MWVKCWNTSSGKLSNYNFWCSVAVNLDTFFSPMSNVSLMVLNQVQLFFVDLSVLNMLNHCRLATFNTFSTLVFVGRTYHSGCFFILCWGTVSRWSTLQRCRGWMYLHNIPSFTGWGVANSSKHWVIDYTLHYYSQLSSTKEASSQIATLWIIIKQSALFGLRKD